MKIVLQIEPQDVERVRAFVDSHWNDPFVQQRVARNLSATRQMPSRDDFWIAMVSCLITTQQRSGPGSAVARFINSVPFPLSYSLCISQDDPHSFVRDVIRDFGLRFPNRLSGYIATNLHQLEQGLWDDTFSALEELCLAQTVQSERNTADLISEHFKGFGPKQSRNLLQDLGLTRYEIPLDSRITKWLNDFGFPIKLSATALADPNYYRLVSDGVQQLCAQSGVYPCVLDAAIFISFDRGG